VPGGGDTRRKVNVAAAAVLALLILVGCSSGGGPDRAESDSGRSCRLSAKAVPSCGVLWGISTQPRTMRHLQSLEKTLGRPFDLVYHYTDINDPFPDAVERQEAADGRLLHVAIAARDFHGRRGGQVSWADVANGKFDTSLTAQAQGVASLHAPVFVTFAQEGNSPKKLGVDGTPADFKAAWRHLHDLYQAAGATNAVWTWVMTGSGDNLGRAASLWPGNDVVDWISWNVYNMAGCLEGGDVEQFQSFQDRMRVFYDFVHHRGPSYGIDASKPMMISETGSVKYAQDETLSRDWYAAIPAALRNYPQVKAVALWDSTTAKCDFKFDTSAVTLAGVRRAGLDPTIDTGSALSVRTAP
jgi:beta-mannanase